MRLRCTPALRTSTSTSSTSLWKAKFVLRFSAGGQILLILVLTSTINTTRIILLVIVLRSGLTARHLLLPAAYPWTLSEIGRVLHCQRTRERRGDREYYF